MLLDRSGSKEVIGEVIATGTQVISFTEPIQSTLECHVQGQTIAMSAGDTHTALLNSGFYGCASFWAGRKVHVCRKQYARAHILMQEYNHLTWLVHMIHMEKHIWQLMGTKGNKSYQF